MGIDRRLAIILACLFAPDLARADSDPKLESPQFSSKVRGDRGDALRRDSGASTQITQEEIKQAQPESSGELLRRVPGIQVRQEDPSGFRLNIGVRGLSPVRSRLVLVEEDGVPVVVSPYGEPELYYMTAVERIQSMDVVKGSDVLLSGPQTVGATIKLHTWQPTDEASWYTALSLGDRGYGELLARYANTIGGVGVMVQAFHKWGDGYRGMGFQASDAMAKVRVPTGRHGELTIKLGFHKELTNTTYTGLTDSMYRRDPAQDTVAPDDKFGIDRYEMSIQHEQRFATKTKLRSAMFAYQMDTNLRLEDFDRARAPGVDYARVADPSGLFFRSTSAMRDRTYHVVGLSEELEQRFVTGPLRHKVTIGVRGMYDRAHRQLSQGETPTSNHGAILTDDTTTIFGLGSFIEDQVGLGKYLVVTPAFRVEYSHSQKHLARVNDGASLPHDVDVTGTASSTGWMPGVGAAFGTPRLNAFTSIYRGYSAPRVSQAITPDGHDADLHAEISTNYEIGARGRCGRWLSAEADMYIINFDNQLVSNNPLSGSTSEFVDGGRTQHIGAEGTAKVRIGTVLHSPVDVDLAGHYTYARSRFVGGSYDGKTVPYSPVHAAQVTLDLAHRIGLSGQVAFSYVGAQYADQQNTGQPGPTGLDGKIDAYTALDVNVRYRNKRTGLSFSVAVKNALNRIYISDRLPNGIFTAGFRQVFATLAWSSND